MAKKIQDTDYLYSFLLPYVNWHTRRSYRRFEVHGKKKLPKDKALIFGVNHSNTLMDALVLLSSNNIKKVFIARGDIFKNPIVAKILTFLRILPIFRIRNGVAAVRQNDDSLNKAVDVIHDHVDLYLFPEGTHRTKHSLMRMGKGLFHIALDANKQRQAEGLRFKIGSCKGLKDGGLEGQESYRSYRIILWTRQFDYKVRLPPQPHPTPPPTQSAFSGYRRLTLLFRCSV